MKRSLDTSHSSRSSGVGSTWNVRCPNVGQSNQLLSQFDPSSLLSPWGGQCNLLGFRKYPSDDIHPILVIQWAAINSMLFQSKLGLFKHLHVCLSFSVHHLQQPRRLSFINEGIMCPPFSSCCDHMKVNYGSVEGPLQFMCTNGRLALLVCHWWSPMLYNGKWKLRFIC